MNHINIAVIDRDLKAFNLHMEHRRREYPQHVKYYKTTNTIVDESSGCDYRFYPLCSEKDTFTFAGVRIDRVEVWTTHFDYGVLSWALNRLNWQ